MSPAIQNAIRAVLTVGLLLLVLGPASAAAQTRAQYAEAADPECADATRDITRLNKRAEALHGQARYRAAGRVLSKTGVRLSRSIAKVRRIEPPPGDGALVDRWLGLIGQVATNNRKMGRAEARANFAAVDRLVARNEATRAKAHELVAGFPFEHCA